MPRVVRHDGTDGVGLPPVERRRVYLVAVAAGGKHSVSFTGGGRDEAGYVHVMEEDALRAILGELDTAADFLHYLETKEAFEGTIVCEGEENLFAVYFHSGRKLPDIHLLVAEDGLWRDVQAKPEFRARKEHDKISYWWDELIETFVKDYDIGMEGRPSPSELEIVVRTMAAENRFARRVLSSSCLDWLERKQAGARCLKSPTSDVGYVFGTFPRELEREFRQTEMSARCLVARSPSVLNCPTIVGLATEVYDPSGYSMDAVYLHLPNWTEQDDEIAHEARERFGIMQAPSFGRASMVEFPRAPPGPKSQAERNRKKRERRARR